MAKITNWARRFNRANKYYPCELRGVGLGFDALGAPPQCLTFTLLRADERLQAEFEAEEVQRIKQMCDEFLERRRADKDRLVQACDESHKAYNAASARATAAEAECERLRSTLERARFRMQMEQWNWHGPTSSDAKREIYAAVSAALAHREQAEGER